MKPGFMSSVCPHRTLDELIATAKAFGYEGLEFRVEWQHNHGIELGATDAALVEARDRLSEAGIEASCLATGVPFNSSDPEEQKPQQEKLKAYIVLASQIGAPYVRTFGDPLPEDPALRDRVLRLAAESYAAVDDWAGQYGVEVLLETHTNMKGEWAARILDGAGAKNLYVLWHIGHHLQRGQSVDEAYGYLRNHVRHVHFVAEEDSEHVTDADNQRSFELLASDGFRGFFSVEIINPEDPDAVLAHHMAKYTTFKESIRDS